VPDVIHASGAAPAARTALGEVPHAVRWPHAAGSRRVAESPAAPRTLCAAPPRQVIPSGLVDAGTCARGAAATGA